MDPMDKENAHEIFSVNVTEHYRMVENSPPNKCIAEIWREVSRCWQRNGRRIGCFPTCSWLVVLQFKITECILFL